MLQNKIISLAIVDDHYMIIEGVKMLLKEEKNIKIKGCFSNAATFESFLNGNKIDIVLLDISLPDSSGIDLCKKIKLLAPKTKVLALSNHGERSIILRMIRNGANGYLLKNVSSKELLSCIMGAMDGNIVFSKEVSQTMANPNEDELKNIPRITKRESEILLLIASGNTTQEIADQLFVSPLTIETHRRNLMFKFDVKNAAELVMEASKHKLI